MPPQHSLNLKQKLSALSLAQSAPSSPNPNYGRPSRGGGSTDAYANTNSPLNATTKRKMFFHAPAWMKKPHGFGSQHQHGLGVYGEEDLKMVQEVLGQMIFQAGVDYEYVVRSFFVLNATQRPRIFLGRAQCKALREPESLKY